MVKKEGWWNGKKIIPFSQMSDEYLQNAKVAAQKKELGYFDKATLLSEIIDKLEAEANKRGIELHDFDSDFHKNRKVLKDSMKVKA